MLARVQGVRRVGNQRYLTVVNYAVRGGDGLKINSQYIPTWLRHPESLRCARYHATHQADGFDVAPSKRLWAYCRTKILHCMRPPGLFEEVTIHFQLTGVATIQVIIDPLRFSRLL